MRKGVPGVKGTQYRRGVPGKPGDHGHFLMVYYNLRSGKVERVKLPSYGGNYEVELDNLVVDWGEGLIVAKKKGRSDRGNGKNRMRDKNRGRRAGEEELP